MSTLDTLPRRPGAHPGGGGHRTAFLIRWIRKLATGFVLIVLPVCVGKFADDHLGAAWGRIPMFFIAPDQTFLNIAAGLAFVFAAGVAWVALRGGQRLGDRVGDRTANALLVAVVIAAAVLPIALAGS